MGNRGECKGEVLAKDLGETLGNQVTFKMGNLTILVLFNVKDPFVESVMC